MREQMENTAPAFRTNRLLQGLVFWLLLLWIVTSIEPFNRRDWFLENLLVFFYGTLLVMTYRRFAFSNRSYVLFTIFMSLHLVGAHYTYSEVPFGFWLQETLGLERNHYDRIVHFSFGLLIAIHVDDVEAPIDLGGCREHGIVTHIPSLRIVPVGPVFLHELVQIHEGAGHDQVRSLSGP